MKADVAFVSCVKTKADRSMMTKDLYISPWFKMARAYVEKNAERWFILSAAHGLLDPDTFGDPYDLTLCKMGVDDRHAWSMRVMGQMAERDLWGDRAIVLAGKPYREFLMNAWLLRYRDVHVPMGGLPLGEQLSWLSKRTQ